jgi:hypothetical protein
MLPGLTESREECLPGAPRAVDRHLPAGGIAQPLHDGNHPILLPPQIGVQSGETFSIDWKLAEINRLPIPMIDWTERAER